MARYLAHFLSYIFHPLLILTYILLILLLINPYQFGVYSVGRQMPLVLIIFFSTFVIPAVSVALMKLLGLVDSLELDKRTDRIGPYIITGIFYTWMFQNLLYNPDIPHIYKIYVLGATIGLFIAFFINLFSKISMHAVGMGGLVGMILLASFLIDYQQFSIHLGTWTYQMTINSLLMLSILLAGAVGSARLVLNAHDPRDLYGGFLVGFCSQFIALYFLT